MLRAQYTLRCKQRNIRDITKSNLNKLHYQKSRFLSCLTEQKASYNSCCCMFINFSYTNKYILAIINNTKVALPLNRAIGLFRLGYLDLLV